MSDERPVVSAEIPEFTGNLEQLETDAGDIAFDGMAVGAAGLLIDANFNQLEPFYKAPEADQLFATTAPVAAAGHDLQTELGTVSKALLDYAAEVRPLVDKLNSLREEAAAFERRVADDDEWVADGDLIDENTARRNAVNAAWAAFQAAELACHNKIVALVGGEPLVVSDGSNKENMYGYRAEDLNAAAGLPWGDVVEEDNPWYYFHEHAWDFTVGFFVDGVWGTIRGLGTLVGVDGWDAAGQAWTGLGKLLTGIVITATPLGAAYWLTPADKLPSWLRESRTAVVETGKALIAYDEWGKNPSRAAGAVTFNVLTTVFTGGAGGAVAATGKAGAVAKAISFAGRAGRIVDPMTYIAKGVGSTAVKISDVMASLRGITNGTHIRLGEGTYQIADVPNLADELPAGLTPENSVRFETSNGEIVYLDTKTLVMHNADGTVRESLDGIKYEATAEQRAAEAARQEGTPGALGEREPVMSGARVGDTAVVGGRGGDTATAAGRGGDSASVGGRGSDGPGGTGGRTDENPPLGRGGGPGGPGGGGLDDLGRTGDDALGDGRRAGDETAGAGDTADDGAGVADEGQQPPKRTPEEAKKIVEEQIRKANDADKTWFDEYYRSDGHRWSTKATDENGDPLPILAKDENGNWIAKDSLPAKPGERSWTDDGTYDWGSAPAHEIGHLEDAARNRQLSKDLTAAEKAYETHPTEANAKTLADAQDAFERAMPSRPNNSSISEALGEEAAMRHVIPNKYPDAQWIDLPKTSNGANMFDQLYRLDDGSLLIVEAKAPQGGLIWRKGAGAAKGWMVKQGTQDYVLTIISEMQKNSDLVARDSAGNPVRNSAGEEVKNGDIADDVLRALVGRKLKYVMVKANESTGSYAGAKLEHFDLY